MVRCAGLLGCPYRKLDSSVSMMEASDASAWMKGQYLAVDGGYTIR